MKLLSFLRTLSNKSDKEVNLKRMMDIDASQAFNHCLTLVETSFLYYSKTTEDKIILIDRIMTCVRNDFIYTAMAEICYVDEPVYMDEIKPPTQISVDALNKTINAEIPLYYKINLAKDSVVAVPWREYSFCKTELSVKRKHFSYSHNSHTAYYFTGIDVTFATNGLHSISAGINNKNGYIFAKIVSLEKLYDYITGRPDGYYDNITDKCICKSKYFQIPLLFELAKIKYNLEKEIKGGIN